MTHWQRELNLQPEWDQAAEREISAQKMALSIAEKLERLPDLSNPNWPIVNQEKATLVEDFRAFSEDPDGGYDDLDVLLSNLYDWGDTTLSGGFFDAKKVCWVNTMPIHEEA